MHNNGKAPKLDKFNQMQQTHGKSQHKSLVRDYFCLILLLSLAGNALNAQADSSQQVLFDQVYSAAEKEYGIHQELINGVLFEKENQDAIGHPYFLDYHSHQGSVIYRGKKYSNLFLQYDIYDQQVLLLYVFDSVEYKLYLHKEFINEFTIEDKRFVNESFGVNGYATIYQVIGENVPIRIFYYWEKYLTNYDGKMPGKNNIFSSDKKKSFLFLHNKLVSYKGNRSFANIFPSMSKTAIKEYFRKNKVKIKEASDLEMELLIRFINTLDQKGNL